MWYFRMGNIPIKKGFSPGSEHITAGIVTGFLLKLIINPHPLPSPHSQRWRGKIFFRGVEIIILIVSYHLPQKKYTFSLKRTGGEEGGSEEPPPPPRHLTPFQSLGHRRNGLPQVFVIAIALLLHSGSWTGM